jgi:hypothetical protein
MPIETIDLPKLPKLQKLKLNYTEIKSLAPENEHKELKVLDLSYTPIETIDFSKFPNLSTLTLTDTSIDKIDVSKATKLQKLILFSMKESTQEKLKPKGELKALTELEIWDVPIKTIERSMLPKLRELSLHGTKLKKFEPQIKLEQLKVLDMSGTIETIDFNKLPHLEELNLFCFSQVRPKFLGIGNRRFDGYYQQCLNKEHSAVKTPHP